jgi:ABC-type uncharacterized transport system permease subunit
MKGFFIQMCWIVIVWKVGDMIFARSVKYNQSVGL